LASQIWWYPFLQPWGQFHLLSFFFPEFTLLKRIFPISSKKKIHNAKKIHQEKSLFWTQLLSFFHSRFICYDPRCNFSFSPQAAAPVIATGQGEPAPTTLVHSLSWARHLRGCILSIQRLGFCLKSHFHPKTVNNSFYVKIEESLMITLHTHKRR
jgi:hypothetical protein